MTSFKQTILITGGNRGIGFQLVKQFAAVPSNLVIATTRSASSSAELVTFSESVNNVKFFELDVSSEESIAKIPSNLTKIIGEGSVDIFVANAAIATPEAYRTVLSATDSKLWLDHYKVNVLGTILTTQTVYPFLAKSAIKKIVWISSIAGSISGYVGLGSSAYGQSKAAINYTLKGLSTELSSEGFTIVAIHPGVVSSDMGKAGVKAIVAAQPELSVLADQSITPLESATGLYKVISDLTTEDNGKFLQYNGESFPW